MRSLKNRFQSDLWWFPVFTLALALGVFAPLITTLGFYWDDWHAIFLIDVEATLSDFLEFYSYNRPTSAWTYLVSAPFLGTTPLKWQLFTLGLRWLSAIGIWLAVREIWPAHPSESKWIAVLFLISPAFALQPISVTFSQHFITYAFFAFSIWMMALAFRGGKRRWVFAVLAALFQTIHMLTLEYLWGLELIRPLLLWVLIPADVSVRARITRTLKSWLPYMVIFLILGIWRVFFLELPGEDPNALVLLDQIRSEPVSGLFQAVNFILRDYVYMLFTSWTDTIAPGLLEVTNRTLMGSWAWALLIAAGSLFVFLRGHEPRAPGKTRSFYRSALPVGLASMGLSLIPGWATGNEITVGMYSSRFAIPAILGSSLVLIGLLDYFVRSDRQKVLILAILIGLAAGSHLRTANDFRWDWVKQTRFYWQLYWRAPSIDPGTAFLSDGAIFKYVGGKRTSIALNALYPQSTTLPELSYWFFEADRSFRYDMDRLRSGVPIGFERRNLFFEGESSDSLVLFYEPEDGKCLWVLRPEDISIRELPELTSGMLPVSNLTRIRVDPSNAAYPVRDIFGPEPEQNWCYFYQKANLALQYQDWGRVTALADQAAAEGFKPNEALEWLTFIEAYLELGDWEAAENISRLAYREKKSARFPVCALWGNHEAEYLMDPDGLARFAAVADALSCSSP